MRYSTHQADVRTINEVSAFVLPNNQHPELFDPRQQGALRDEDLAEQDIECETLRENFSVYKMDNSDVVSLKTVVGEISKFKIYTRTGEPIYNVHPTPVLKIKKQEQQKR